MLRKFVCAAVVVVIGLSVVAAEEIAGTITKVDGNKITMNKKGKKGAKGEEVTLTAADSVKVLKGKFNADTKKLEAGDAIEGGLKSETFTKIGEKGVGAVVTTNDDNKVTQIIVGGGKKKAAN